MDLLSDVPTGGTAREVVFHFARRLAQVGVVQASFRAGVNEQSPEIVDTTMPRHWFERYVDSGYIAVDPGPERARAAVGPIWMSFDRQHWSYDWTGRLDDMADDLRQMGIGASVVVPMAPLPGHRFCLASFYVTADEPDLEGWLQRQLPLLETASALIHYRCGSLLRAHGLAQQKQDLDAIPSPLTDREREVLKWLSSGERVDRIAWRMSISARTVEFHAANARRKLGARTREQAVASAVVRGLI